MTDTPERILFVDDEPAILEGIRRQLRKHYTVAVANGGTEALAMLQNDGPFAVVVSDYQMPQMNGVEFLTRVREASPNTVRMMLTGQADMQSTIDAVNEGNIFRFLTKPCPTDALCCALDAGLAQWRLINAERELLQRTLAGSVKVLTEVLSLVHPSAFSRALRIRRHVDRYLAALEMDGKWQVSLAATLCQLGYITLPATLVKKLDAGLPLSLAEEDMYRAHPAAGRDVIAKIPRLGVVAEILGRQNEGVDPGWATLDVHALGLPQLGGQLLRIAFAVDEALENGEVEDAALKALIDRPDEYHPRILVALSAMEGHDVDVPSEEVEIRVSGLQLGMVFTRDVNTTDGVLLVARGQEVSDVVMHRLKNYALRGHVEEPLYVRQAAA